MGYGPERQSATPANVANQQEPLSKSGGPTLYPILEVVDGKLTISEGGRSREVTPHWDGELLRVGCTTVTKEAIHKIIQATKGVS